MLITPRSILRNLLLFLVVGTVVLDPQLMSRGAESTNIAATDTPCRFGITSVQGSEGYDITSIGVGSYLDWGAVNNPSLPEGVEYIRVLRVRDDIYPGVLANLPTWVQSNPGSVWVIGNEPDTTYGEQDALLPEVYADRYFELAKIIRSMDMTAQVAFGSVVQPTPIRLRYLNRAWNQLAADAGSTSEASKLIDIWSIHAFILNEGGFWGTGIPPGFENDHDDAVIIIDFRDTYSIEIFTQRVTAFRQWMADKGERDKPLWITEYGSLFPPIDPPGGPNYVNVSDEDTRDFMLATFDFLLSAADEQTGLPRDGNQLVQRWYWYSLNGHRYNFGGSIFNPDYPDFGPRVTAVGEGFINYQASNLVNNDLYPANLSIAPRSYNQDHTLVNYRVDVTLGNNQYADASCAQVWIFDGDPDAGGTLIAGPIPASAIHNEYGAGKLTAYWMNVQPLTTYTLYVVVDSIGVQDLNPDNNKAAFTVYTELPKLNFLTFVQH